MPWCLSSVLDAQAMLAAQVCLPPKVSCLSAQRFPSLYKAGFPPLISFALSVMSQAPLSRECHCRCYARPSQVAGLPSLLCVLGSRTRGMFSHVAELLFPCQQSMYFSLPLIYLAFLPWCAHGAKVVPTCHIVLESSSRGANNDDLIEEVYTEQPTSFCCSEGVWFGMQAMPFFIWFEIVFSSLV